MPSPHDRRVSRVASAFCILSLVAGSAHAQLSDILDGGLLSPAGEVGGQTPQEIVSLFAHITPPSAGRPAMLSVTAHIEPPWYTYSTTQKPVKATPTVFTLDPSDDYRLLGEFRSTLPPKIVRDGDDVLEELGPEVTWEVPLELSDVDPNKLRITGTARIQVCKVGTCLPPTVFAFEAALRKEESTTASVVEYRHPDIHATIRGYLEPRTVTPGSTVNLVLTAEADPNWHVYALASHDPGDLGYKPTVIGLSNTSGFDRRQTMASEPAVEKPGPLPGMPRQRYHEGPVTWTTPIVIPEGTQPGTYPIDGYIGYQTCLDDRCDAPRGAKFSGTFEVASTEQAGAAALSFTDARYNEAAKVAANQPPPIDGDTGPVVLAGSALKGWTLPVVILAGLLGGFILNFMPCVLPVIGLKVLSFAEQAGRSRSQILALNVWFALGTLTVLWVLAALASSVSLGLGEQNLGWGEQFSYTSFNVVMVGIVFVMALSFLGVWEIPIPGFVGSGKANDLAAREGVAGAYSKGVLATILATPCSGPALGPVFGYTLNQPPQVTFLLFTCIGLGMSSPYLLIGAFPKLIRFLPKPGAWMDTFKNMMGFVLLGTIVFLFSFMDRDYLVPTFAMIVGLWAACWWIGRTSLTETLGRKLMAWGQGAAFAAVVTLAAFTWLVPRDSIIPWQPFSQTELARLKSTGNTVLVDFTADWCLTCKANLALAIETKEVGAAIDKLGIVPLLADYTKGSPEIKDTLASLESTSIPLLAIYPADRPDEPIVLRDVITKQQLLNAIERAGPSKNGSKLTAAMP